MTEKRLDRSSRNRGMAAAMGSLVGLWLPGGAAAAELKLPQVKPAVSMNVPDDWTTEKTGKGVETRSPQQNAIVVAEVIPRDKAGLDAWAKRAAIKLKAFGVAFDAKATAPAKPEVAAPIDNESAFTKRPDAFTFSGKPSLATPGAANSNDPVKPGKTSIEALTGFGTEVKKTGPMPKLPFKAVQYYGTTLKGKPVDVQLVTYNLADKRLFVMMQESEPEDGRAVAIATSVRGVRAEAK